jgi:HAE1 family hydrophobic/amphiphilic exporter-1
MFRLASLSMSNKALIALVTIFAAIFGVITMGTLKQELIPSIEFPQLTVVSSMPGASPDVVDKQVGQPLEKALQAVEGLESSASTSRTGVSTIRLSFAYGTNLDRARNQIDRAVSTAKQQLPANVTPNTLAGSVSDFPIVFIAASSRASSTNRPSPRSPRSTACAVWTSPAARRGISRSSRTRQPWQREALTSTRSGPRCRTTARSSLWAP